ncbi:hypothetical protein [Mesorhizobium sp. CN2-181]|uniref:hypothetical protein n=1 Tax=Mesorhizobium TaxID=68287 RepID=UPI0032B8665B
MVKLTEENRRKTLTACYDYFGVDSAGKNVRRWWTDRAPNGEVVVTLWVDHFQNENLTEYSTFNRSDLAAWVGRSENHQRRDLLQNVGIGGTFQSIVQRYADPNRRPRVAAERYIGRPMRLTALDEHTGEFSAREIDF